MSLATSGLNSVFSALIVSRILYALPAFYGFILQSDVDRIDAMFRKAKRWGITTDEFAQLGDKICIFVRLPEGKNK